MALADKPKMDLRNAYEEFARDRAEGDPSRPDMSGIEVTEGGKQLAPESILKMRAGVFQPRSLKGQFGEEEHVLKELVDAIKREGAEALDPVIVWWTGAKFIVVDGHHRLIAVRRYIRENQGKKGFTKKPKVPVSIVTGEIAEAKRFSTRENGKVKLSMRKEDRINWAWRQVALHFGGIDHGEFKMVERCRDLHVSERLLQDMKAVMAKLWGFESAKQLTREVTADIASTEEGRERVFEVADWPWATALKASQGELEEHDEYTDEMRSRDIERARKSLVRALGHKAFSDPRRVEITGEALLEINSRFLELAGWSPEVEEAMKMALSSISGESLAGLEDELGDVGDEL